MTTTNIGKAKKTLFACKVCKYETRNSNFLKSHKRLVHGPKAGASDVLSCTECGFEATQIIHLENHINAGHLNEKRFACTSCDFQSFFSQSVKSHIISKHKGSTAAQRKTLECSIVNWISSTANVLLCGKKKRNIIEEKRR